MSASFFAYPSNPPEISTTIRESLRIISDDLRIGGYAGWEENDIAGRFIREPIIAQIQDCDVLAADVTRLNFNVIYEVGYGIGKNRRVILTRNSSITADDSLVREVGIFDTLGYKQYSKARDLAKIITRVSDLKPLDTAADINKRAPLYVVLPKTKTDYEVHLLSQVKKTRLQWRTFDPDELGRMSAQEAIIHVSSSYGVLVPLLPSTRKDATVHNMRAAFIAGLAHGMEKEILLFQFGEDPVPLDYRDLVRHVGNADQIGKYIAEFAPSITALLQSDVPPIVTEPKTFLARLNIGAPYAENEMTELAEYYLETDEFRKVARGEVQIVAGRKGSGKTALFFQLRDKYRPSKQNIVLDLRPEGFQLRKFKDMVLLYLEEGTKEHTITAFWEYLLLLEICHKILETDRDYHMTANHLFQPYNDLAKEYRSDAHVAEGDFAERMLKLLERIIEDFQGVLGGEGTKTRLSSQQLTNILYKHDTKKLRERITAYLGHKREIWILFDNLDKGWPPRGLSDEDALILRCLVDAMGKLSKYIDREGTKCHGVLFLRNDVYEHLVENTSDRGKTSKVLLDWTDPEMLREMIRRRLVANNLPRGTPFEKVWQDICVTHIDGQETSDYLLERCLMRPRSLIELISACRAHAVNLEKSKIDEKDIEEGEKIFASALVENIGLEMRDVYPDIKPDVKDIVYEFIGQSLRMNQEEVFKAFEAYGIEQAHRAGLLDLLLWWGFFGVARDDGGVTYIYSVQYHMSHLKALLRKFGPAPVFYINPAFWLVLEIKTK
jgi:hypothetical protein